MTWSLERHRGSAAAFHARLLTEPVRPTVAVLEVDRPALVLGSTQDPGVVDRAAVEAAGVEVVRRRSGGGAVLVEPGGAVWVDVVIPRQDPRWSDDVGRASHWVGAVWAAALGELGIEAAVHEGGLCTTTWSRLVCFGGLGPGEVTVGGRKAVGLAQRRSRPGAWFQTMAPLAWDAGRLVDLLALDPTERATATEALQPVVSPLDVDGDIVIDALLAHLPD